MKKLLIALISVIIIALCVTGALFLFSDEETVVSFQDNNLFTGGISAGMNLKEATKASAKSLWFDGKLDNYERSVKRADVDSAEFTYHDMALKNGDVITPRVTFDDEGDIICVGVSIYLRNAVTEEDYIRLLESYKKDFMRQNIPEGMEEIISETTAVKQIGEKSTFRTSTKLFYDTGVKNCHYWFDKSTKTGYAIYEIDRTGEAGLAKYELAFLQFKY